jgi:spore coat polysaccharide biosynthesis protein SpsF
MGLTAVVLQARLDSSRLPGKALLPLGGRPLIFRVMEALRQVRADLRILASPEDCAASFGPLAEEAGFSFLAGPKEDVLGRYCLAIRRFGLDRVIRATGDNPFVFTDAAEAINAEAAALEADYAAYSGLPHGAGVESVAAAALLRAGEEADDLSDREHVCPYLYKHPALFLLHRPLAPPRWRGPSLRVTVDTEEDYRRASAVYQALGRYPALSGPGGETRYQGSSIIAVQDIAVQDIAAQNAAIQEAAP